MLLPTDSEPSWPGGSHPVKMPFVTRDSSPAGECRLVGACKNIYRGLDPNVVTDGGTLPDVYDPAYLTLVNNSYAPKYNLSTYKDSPYFIGVYSDDTDYMAGFGPGTDFPTDPVGSYHCHNGVLALITAPSQSTNPYNNNHPYTDPKVYMKYALRDFLAAKYVTVAGLNSAWGSSYTTFDSSGGWPNGTGLLDENGRSTHAWLGSPIDRFLMTGMRTQVRADLDTFLVQLSEKYFSINRAALKAVAPSALFFGPTNLGGAGARGPARPQVLQAAGQYLDLVNIGTDHSQAELNWVAPQTGDVPIAIWDGVTAHARSARLR